jgi:hypothetical protein
LKVNPELGAIAKIPGKPQGGFGRDAALAVKDLSYATRRHTHAMPMQACWPKDCVPTFHVLKYVQGGLVS